MRLGATCADFPSPIRCLETLWFADSVLWLEAFESLAASVEGGAVPGRFCCRAEGRGALYNEVEGGAVAVESGLSTLVVDESVVGLGIEKHVFHSLQISKGSRGIVHTLAW